MLRARVFVNKSWVWSEEISDFLSYKEANQTSFLIQELHVLLMVFHFNTHEFFSSESHFFSSVLFNFPIFFNFIVVHSDAQLHWYKAETGKAGNTWWNQWPLWLCLGWRRSRYEERFKHGERHNSSIWYPIWSAVATTWTEGVSNLLVTVIPLFVDN